MEFRGTFTPSYAAYKEVLLNYSFERPASIAAMILVILFASLSIGAGIIFTFITPDQFYNNILIGFGVFLLISIILISLLNYSMAGRNAKVFIQRIMEINCGGKRELALNEGFVSEFPPGQTPTNIAFPNVNRVYTTKNYLVVVSKALVILPIEKASITGGTWEECVNFIKQRIAANKAR